MSIAGLSLPNSSTPHDEESSVLAMRDADGDADADGHDELVTGGGGMTRDQAWNLYTSHFLSTWNVRGYEFAVVGVSVW